MLHSPGWVLASPSWSSKKVGVGMVAGASSCSAEYLTGWEFVQSIFYCNIDGKFFEECCNTVHERQWGSNAAYANTRGTAFWHLEFVGLTLYFYEKTREMTWQMQRRLLVDRTCRLDSRVNKGGGISSTPIQLTCQPAWSGTGTGSPICWSLRRLARYICRIGT